VTTTRRRRDRPSGGRPPAGPDPVRLARAVVVTWLEIEAGRRPLEQLAPLLAPVIARRIAASVRDNRRRGVVTWGPGADTVVACHGQSLDEGSCDAVVVVRTGRRIAAVAVRLERHRGAWRVVELARPEDGYDAVRTASLPDAPPTAALSEAAV